MSEEKPLPVNRNFKGQLVGMFAGGGLGLMLFSIFPFIQNYFDMLSTVILAAMLGVILFSFDQLEASGRVITRSDNRILNILVALIIPLLFLLILAWMLK